MRKTPQRERNKPRFCCDNNFQFRILNKECNKYGIYIHVNHLIKKPNPTDPEIIKFCIKNDYHVITHNKVNFKNYNQTSKIGIFYIGSIDPKYWLNLFIKYMRLNNRHSDSYFKTVSIEANKIEVLKRK